MNSIRIDKSYHVGTLNANDKREDSYEGSGLSISMTPSAWRRIAKGRVAGKCFEVSAPSGLNLVLMHEIATEQRDLIREWGIQNEYIRTTRLFKVEHYDDNDDVFFSLYDTYDEAYVEADEDPDVISQTVGAVALDRLLDVIGRTYIPSVIAEEILTLLYLELETEFDGAWWDDKFDPASLSAPRGVIFKKSVPACGFRLMTCEEEARLSNHKILQQDDMSFDH